MNINNSNNKIEIIFYKVIHNKYLFNIIINQLKRLNSDYQIKNEKYIYQRYSSANEIIKHNVMVHGIGLLGITSDSFSSIKKDNKDNSAFYDRVFTINYQYIKDNNQPHHHNINSSRTSELDNGYLYNIIYYSNIVAFKSFIKIFQVSTKEIIHVVVNFYSNGCYFNNIPMFEYGVLQSARMLDEGYNGIKMLDYCVKNYNISTTSFTIKLNIKQKRFKKMKLKQIIKYCKLIIEYKELLDNKDKIRNINNINKYNNSLEEQFKLFTNDQLDSNFISLLASTTTNSLSSSPSINNKLRDLLFSYYEVASFTNSPADKRHYLLKLKKKLMVLKSTSQDLEYCLKLSNESTSFFNIFSYSSNKFKYSQIEEKYWVASCSNSSSLKDSLNLILVSEDYLKSKSIGAIVELLKYNNQQTFEYIASLNSKYQQVFENVLQRAFNLPQFGLSLSTKLIIDHCYINYRDMVFKNKNEYWKYIPVDDGYSILEYYESRLASLERKASITNIFHLDKSRLNLHDINDRDAIYNPEMKCILEKLLRAANTPSIYEFDQHFTLSTYSIYLVQYFNSGEYEKQITVLLILTQIVINHPIDLTQIINNDSSFKNGFLNWIIDNYQGNEKVIKNKFQYGDGRDGPQIIEFTSSLFVQGQSHVTISSSIAFRIKERDLFKLLYSRGQYRHIFRLIDSGIFIINEPAPKEISVWGSVYFKCFTNYKLEFIQLLVDYILHSNLSNIKTLSILKCWFSLFLSQVLKDQNIQFLSSILNMFQLYQIKNIIIKEEVHQLNNNYISIDSQDITSFINNIK